MTSKSFQATDDKGLQMNSMAATTEVNFDNPPKELIKPIRFAHVVLRTSDKARLRDFYCTFLGAKIQHEKPNLVFITYDDEHHRIAIIEIPDTAPKHQQTCGLEHIAYTFANLTELLLAYRQKVDAGIKPFWCVNHGPTISIYWKDPDGNRIETQVDCFETNEEANDFLASAEFAENPFGVDFVPEEFMERIKKGESEESIMKRPNIGPRDIPPFMV